MNLRWFTSAINMDNFLLAIADLPTLLARVSAQLDANAKVLEAVTGILGTTQMYEKEAAKDLNVSIGSAKDLTKFSIDNLIAL